MEQFTEGEVKALKGLAKVYNGVSQLEPKDVFGVALLAIGAFYIYKGVSLLQPILGVLGSAAILLLIGIVGVVAGWKYLFGR